jgi:hypothetical protein
VDWFALWPAYELIFSKNNHKDGLYFRMFCIHLLST